MRKGYVLLLVQIIFFATIGTLAATSMMEPPLPVRDPIFKEIALFFNIVNITLCAVLIFLYLQIWRKTRSEFTVGLIVLSMALMLHTLASNPFISRGFGFPQYNLGPFSILPVLFTTVALSVLLYLASR